MLVSSSPYKKGKTDALSVLESPKRTRESKIPLGLLPVLQEGDALALPTFPIEQRREASETKSKERESSSLDKSCSLADEQTINQSELPVLTNVVNDKMDTENDKLENCEGWKVEAVNLEENERPLEENEQEKKNEIKNEKRSESENGANVQNESKNGANIQNEIKNEKRSESENETNLQNESENETNIQNESSIEIENDNSIEIAPINLNSPKTLNSSFTSELDNSKIVSSTNENDSDHSTLSQIQHLLTHFRKLLEEIDQNQTDPKEIREIQNQMQQFQGLSIDPLNIQLIQEISDLFKTVSLFFQWFSGVTTNRSIWFSFFFFCIQFIQSILLENKSIKLFSFSHIMNI